jgi:glycosyltransferase involved in cell wall biosynthesis
VFVAGVIAMAKILHINDYPVETGGAEVIMRATLALLRQRGITTATFTSGDLGDTRRTPLRYLHNSQAQKALASKLAAFQPDVVHLHNFYHILSPGILVTLENYKRQHSVRVVMTAHDYHLACPNSGGSWFRWLSGRREVIGPNRDSLACLLLRNWDHRSCLHSLLKLVQHTWNYRWHHRQRVIDLVVCPSRCVQMTLEASGLKTRLLPHPAPPLPMSRPLRTGPLRFVFAGRIEPEKGLNELLRCWPADFPARLIIIGDGSQTTSCRATCRRRGLAGSVEFAGRLPHAETMARIANCHVLVQPSRFLETYGLTLIEALASGTNVLAASRPAAREIVEASGVGFLFELDDLHSLTAQLHAIRRSYEAGTLNHFAISNFLQERSESRYIDQLLQVYGLEFAKHLVA